MEHSPTLATCPSPHSSHRAEGKGRHFFDGTPSKKRYLLFLCMLEKSWEGPEGKARIIPSKEAGVGEQTLRQLVCSVSIELWLLPVTSNETDAKVTIVYQR